MADYYDRMYDLLNNAPQDEFVEDTLKLEILETDDPAWRAYCEKAVDVLENPEKYLDND
jgi:hypothetical protein